jgi:hypothetical protein
MAESTHQVSTHIKLVDKLSAPLRGISGIVGQLTHGFDHLSSHIASFATLGAAAVGALSIHKMIEETNEHMRTVSRLKTITGDTTANVDGMVEAFDKAGIGGSETERIMMMLSRAGAKMEDTLQSAAAGIPKAAERMRALGVDVTNGPYNAMIGLSVAVQKGRVDVAKLSRMFSIRPQMALDFMKLLKRGPQYVGETIDEMKKSGTELTDENIAAFKRFQDVKNEVAAGWKRVQIVIGKELYPVLEQLLRNVQDKIPGWIEGAKTFGKFLHDHLSDAIGLAKTLGKVMLINATVMKVTSMAGMGEGKGVGILGALRAGGGRFMAGSGALGEKTMRGLAGVPIGPLSAGQTQMTPLMGVLMRLVQVGPTAVIVMALIAAAVIGFKAVMDNFNGLKSMLSDTWSHLKATFSVFAKLFERNGPASSALGRIVYVFKVTLPVLFEGLLIVVDLFVTGLTKLVRFMDETLSGSSIMTTLLSLTPAGFAGAVAGSNSPIDTWKRVSAQVEAEQHSARVRPIAEAGWAKIHGVFGRGAPEQRGTAPYNDFRGSHFEITQSFDKGFDPDRIAVAFANDLATVGERRMQSGFAPMFSVR